MFASVISVAQAEKLRDLAHRARRLAAAMEREHDRVRLEGHASDLEAQAAELEIRGSPSKPPNELPKPA
jgi:hypothetical protein